MKKVYLAGQPAEYDNWKTHFSNLKGFDFYDPDIDSDQSSPDTFFPQDLKAVSEADFLIANPGLSPSEGTWIEVGYFLALNTTTPGEKCKNLIIIWNKGRGDWSVEFVKKAGFIVKTTKEAIKKLHEITK
ncbi:nucleoside 2-deoxyribosyltransferase [bacterium]|nr:nucleoside 2-deoxyribosyltransferase [bacterium]